MNRGAGKFYVIFAILLVGGLVYGITLFGPVYQHQWRLEKEMEEILRTEYARQGEEKVVEDLIQKAQEFELPPLTPDNFSCEDCEVDKMSTFTCDYTERINFPGDKFYDMPIHVEVNIKIPPPAF